MDKTSPTSNDAAQILSALRDLYNEGQTGFLVLIAVFVVAVLLFSYLIYAQRQALSFVDSRIKAVDQQMKALGATIQTVDLQMKAADAVRLESREAQESSAKDITGRVETIATINDELRKELERIKNSQNMLVDTQRGLIASHKQLKEDIKTYITLGLDDIKERMSTVTVTQLIEQLPPVMKAEIDSTMKDMYDSVAKTATERFQTISTDSVVRSEFINKLEEKLIHHTTYAVERSLSDMFHHTRYQGNDFLDALVDRITLRLEQRLSRGRY
jgi:hypothetical protein